MAYLDDHPPATTQFRRPRRAPLSGIIGVHTAENHADEQGTDSGAENVADYIRRRSGPGSYHLLVDSDSIIELVDLDAVAYHIGTHGLNEHTVGISAAVQAHEWTDYGDEYVRDVVVNMAKAAAKAARHIKRRTGITVPARRISLAEALAGKPGFLAHGDADPARRTDPGPRFDWDLFLDTYAALMAGGTPDSEDDMPYKDWPDQHRKALVDDVVEGILSAGIDRYNGKNKVQVRTILGWTYRDAHQLNQNLVSRLLNARVRRHNGEPARLETLLGWIYRDGRDDPALVVENPDGGKNSKPVALAAIWRLLSGKDDPSETVRFAAASAGPAAQIEDDASDDVPEPADLDADGQGDG